jgi:hypothetical protein
MVKGYTPPTPFREWLNRLVTPSAWVMLAKYDPDWDHYVRVGIMLGMVEPVYFSENRDPKWMSEHEVKIGPYEIWVGNYPYHYGTKMTDLGSTERRPSIGTMRLLKIEQRRIQRESMEGSI